MDHAKVVRAEIVTAVDAAGRSRRGAPAGPRAGDRTASARSRRRIDPSIIGGAIARIGSTVYDGSVTRQLQKMKETLVDGDSRRQGEEAAASRSRTKRADSGSRATGQPRQPRGTWTSKLKRSPRSSATRSAATRSTSTSPKSARIVSIGDGIARVHGVENDDGGRDARVPARRVRHRAEPRRRERRRGAARRVHRDQGRRHGQAHRPHHLGAGRRGAARPRGQRARPADRRQGPDRLEAVHARSSASRRASSIASRSRSRCRPASRRSTRWCRSAAASAS